MEKQFQLCPNPLVKHLQKNPKEFTVEDIISYIKHADIKMLSFHYIGGDGRIKTLNFVITSEDHLRQLLFSGERVDGSSLFSHMETGSSDLYVVPKFRTAFINPFSEIPTLGMFCRYFDKDGSPLQSSPENILIKAHDELVAKTGLTMHAMGELEYYIISEREDLFAAADQKGYHESFPFTKWEDLRKEAMLYIAQMGGKIKYGHSEVGNFSDEFYNYEQNEIEFVPTDIEEAAEQLLLGKWILRSLAYKYGVSLSFAPKITVGKAGSGLHIHMKLLKDGVSVMSDENGLSEIARRAIAGILELAPSLTAFGNTVPTSYLRLVPHQEAPTNICWGDRNRSVLVRVPLGWSGNASKMTTIANPAAEEGKFSYREKQTFEFRCPDGSADIYLLLAGLTVAACHGLTDPDSLKKSEESYVDVNIFHAEHKDVAARLKQLPVCCAESADELEKQKSVYLAEGVFPDRLINSLLTKLRSYDDCGLSEKLYQLPDNQRIASISALVEKHLHC
ncbi:MAG: glutamine synthetase [Bacteroidetes bacterium HGW-Bacteroidetes-6]|jgi:glutamine synthetase|nr:MAG: glutamine synthetase [Bacteroidetes bacterium HGW-Bacteroidetes-6]